MSVSSEAPRPAADLEIRSRRDSHRPDAHGNRLVLDGRRSWIVEGDSEKIGTIVGQAPEVAEKLADSVAILDFGNAVGRVRLPYLGTVEVVSGKWDREAFDALLDEVTRRAAELPFRAGEAGALPYERRASDRRRILYHCFAYLRHVLSEAPPVEQRLHRSYRLVLREPHREWRRDRERVDIGRARRVDATSLDALFGRSTEFVEARSSEAKGTALSRALDGHLPERVEERRDYSSVDTPENRFLKAFLRQVERIIDEVEELARDSDRKLLRRRVERECRDLRERLLPITRHSMWADVGSMRSLPSASTILHRRRGYRTIFRHYSQLRLAARLPLSEEEIADLLEIKDIALLYELWTFFRLSSMLEQWLGAPGEATTVERSGLEASVAWGTDIRWSNGVRLVYNARFNRRRSGARRSYSVPLRPDILLRVPEGPNAGLHLFDAKFRLRRIGDVVPDEEDSAADEDPGREERRGTFKRGDLYKMHTYRDALPDVRSVWILYPGTESRFFSPDEGEMSQLRITAPVRMDGVGALPLKPGVDSNGAAAHVVGRLTPADPVG